MSDILDDFTPGAVGNRAARYTLDAPRTLVLTDGATRLERIGAGVLTSKPDTGAFLVHENGGAQSALPLKAVANAIVTGKVIPFDVLAAVMVRTGTAGEMQKALAAAIKTAKEAAGS